MAATSEKIPKAMLEKFNEITRLTDAFCEKHLNEEYAFIIRIATAALCRKRPSPLLKYDPVSWACGITYAIGFVNFLFDKSSQPHIRADELCAAWNVTKSMGETRSRQVRDLLDLFQLHPGYTLPSEMNDNPYVWHIMVNGFIIDARYADPEIQQIAFEKGLIPYIPENKPMSIEEKRQEECQRNKKPPKPENPLQSSLF
ncbi:MAG TPA: DUF6398 domain-containing protein [bacterium]|nr:DUF6398 domain-containing protein [bacterium]HPN42467.1 DUF6398 domain-containing protein [bacterium]